MKAKLLLLGLAVTLCCTNCAKSIGDGPDDILGRITDTEFRAYCTEQMADWDKDGNGKLSPKEAAAVRKIEFDGSESSAGKARSLSGIEYFGGLTELYCHNNALTELVVSGFAELEYLNCRGNKITALDVSQNTELLRLSCYDNMLTGLDISKNIKLNTLWCDGNPGKGGRFAVKAWFDDDSIPRGGLNDFTSGDWEFDDEEVSVEYSL